MATLQPPPTWALPMIYDEVSKQATFNPIWLQWFVELAAILTGIGGSTPTHNSLSGLQGGTASQYYHLTGAQHSALTSLPTLAHGTYTPTLTNVTNVAASTAYACQWMQIGATVTVSGKVDVDPTAAGLVRLGISLPVASNFATAQQCGGAAACPAVAGQSAAIVGDATNDRAEMQWIAVDLANREMDFVFTYRVI